MFDFAKLLKIKPFLKEKVEGIPIGKRLDIDEDTVIEFFNWWAQPIEFLINLDYEEHGMHTTLSDDMMYARGITFEEFHDLFNSKIEPEEYSGYRVFQFLKIKSEKRREDFLTKYSNDKESYLRIIQKFVNPKLVSGFLEQKMPPILPYKKMLAHTYVTAPSQVGKTQLLRHMFFELQSRYKKISLVLIDPHGKLANDVMKSALQVDKERFIYIDPKFGGKENFPAFNILEISDLSEFNIDNTIDHFSTAFVDMLGDDADLSTISKGLLDKCIEFLLQKENSTLLDLRKLCSLKPEILKEAIEYDDYFLNTFQRDEDVSRKAVLRRLNIILRSKVAQALLGRKSTFDFEEAINSSKVIVFNLSILSENVKEAVGKFLIASIKSYVMKRDIENETPISTFVFVDECQKFVSGSYEKMLDEMSKFGLHLVLANQRFNQLKEHGDSVKNNTSIKIVSGDEKSELDKVISLPTRYTYENNSNEKSESGSRLKLSEYEFILQVRHEKTMKIKSPSYLIDNSDFELTKEEFEELKEYQLEHYYSEVNWDNKEKKNSKSELQSEEDAARIPPFKLFIKENDE